MTAINIGNYLSTPYGVFPYTTPLGLDSVGIQIYMLGKRSQSLGIEVLQARYNIGLLRILWEIGSDGTTPDNFTAKSSASVDKDILNIKSDIIEQYWQSTSLDEWFQFDCGNGKTLNIDTLALIGTNLTTSAVITIYGYGTSSSPAPVSWAGIPALYTIPMPSDFLERNVIYIANTRPINQYRHYRITIQDPTNSNGCIKIGRFVAGASLIFTTENCLDKVTYKRNNFKDEFSINGFTSIANNRSLKKSMTLNFKDLNRIQYVNYKRLMQYSEYCRDTLKALVIIDPQEPYQFSVFAKLTEMPEETHNYISADTSTVELTLSYDEGK